MLLDYFQKDTGFVKDNVHPDEVVARGAAILAYRHQPSPMPFDLARAEETGLVNPDVADDLANLLLITEHSLGVEVQKNLFVKIISRGTNLPCSVTQDGFTNAGPSRFIYVRVFQGEGQYCYENTVIGTVELGEMEERPEGYHKFRVTFSLDDNGLLTAMVHHVNEDRIYQGHFDQKTAIGGTDALQERRRKLLEMYDVDAIATRLMEEQEAAAAPPPPGHPDVPPPPPPPPPPGGPAAAATPATPAGETPPAAGAEPSAPPSSASAAAASTGAVPGLLELVAPVNDTSFKALIRKVTKFLIAQHDEGLLAALNAFITGLNENFSEDELLDLYGELDNVYHDCRRKLPH